MSYESRRSGVMGTKILVAALAIVAIAGIAYYLTKGGESSEQLRELPSPLATVAENSVTAAKKPSYQEPLRAKNPEPLPALNQSDVAVVAALQGLSVNGLLQLVIPEEILRKFVRAVDAIEDGKLINEYRPIVSPKGALLVDSYQATVAGSELGTSEQVEQFRVSIKNAKRYEVYASVLSLLNADAVAAMYKRFYPLLNEAYQEMGLNKGDFHSVFIRAIDNVLAAPEVAGEMLLIRPKVYYEFADPALEALPATHKLMLRMGAENAKSIKASLQALREKLLQK
jgi:hypothetical protein